MFISIIYIILGVFIFGLITLKAILQDLNIWA